ncbi:MAG: hypothetical protein IBJ00_02915 [Alphaproteobacteria bacterium]|nr:hypothetical protein [Alphaproteobacteria bacterium]
MSTEGIAFINPVRREGKMQYIASPHLLNLNDTNNPIGVTLRMIQLEGTKRHVHMMIV